MGKKDVNSMIAKGAVWMVALRASIKFIGIISTVILARLLNPDDFGLVALGTSLYAMVLLMRQFGFDTVLIQKQDATEDHYNTAWTMKLILSSVASVLIVLLCYPFSVYYSDERLVNVLLFMSAIVFLSGFVNVGIVQFRKEMNFDLEFKFRVIAKLTTFFITIYFAFLLESYVALLIGMLSSQLITLVLSYIMHAYRPRFSIKMWKDMLSFSIWLFANNILIYLNNHGQNFIIAKMLGSAPLGLFTVGNEIANLTASDVVAPINSAAYSGYAKVSSDIDKLRDTYLKVLSNVLVISLPCALGICAVANLLVPVMLGEKWVSIIPVMELIAVSSIFASVTACSGYVYLALAKQYITTYLMLIRIIIFFTLLILLSDVYGMFGAGLAVLITSIIIFPVSKIVISRILSISPLSLLSIFIRPVIASLTMYFVVEYYTGSVDLSSGLVFDGVYYLLISVFIGAFIYCAVLLSLWGLSGRPNTVESYVLNWVDRKYRTISNRA
ncbi:lipopolysaccharide biosynthesis protein [Motiliproteus coralliicola]|uniref:Lipopolysaccharide biosynthesis protein n=1 Tax=Motiliproteus coralliicola TaxID=2283196 RepID=A0A369WUR6_9GAMM|nr:lipopolysaccharide biosynthesis protein [Motiliproteus coralliicola]RDE24809.1 lipopolysaccharide biosynthesis protein [Motiliproteus coralliicola]